MSKTLPTDCEKNLRETVSNPDFADQIVALFNQMIEHAESNDLPAVTVVLPLYHNNSGLVEGDWAGELHLVGRKVVEVLEVEEGDEEEEGDEDA